MLKFKNVGQGASQNLFNRTISYWHVHFMWVKNLFLLVHAYKRLPNILRDDLSILKSETRCVRSTP